MQELKYNMEKSIKALKSGPLESFINSGKLVCIPTLKKE